MGGQQGKKDNKVENTVESGKNILNSHKNKYKSGKNNINSRENKTTRNNNI